MSCPLYPFTEIPLDKWVMCTLSEALERSTYKELSIFEYTSSFSSSTLNDTRNETSHKNKLANPSPDPYQCVQKYRRSAAGGGVSSSPSSSIKKQNRSLEDLEITLFYLLGNVFPRQRVPSHPTKHPQITPPHSLCTTLLFLDDRIRAIQVDITILNGVATSSPFSSIPPTVQSHGAQPNTSTRISRIRNMQARLIRYNILSQYLMSGKYHSPKHQISHSIPHSKVVTDSSYMDYEWKFAQLALQTALRTYLDTWRQIRSEEKESPPPNRRDTYGDMLHHHYYHDLIEKDEMMSYAVLLHMAAIVQRRERTTLGPTFTPTSMDRPCGLLLEDGEGMNAILSFCRKYCPYSTTSRPCWKEQYPKLYWSLQFVSAIDHGNFVAVLRMLSFENQGDLDNLFQQRKRLYSSYYVYGMESTWNELGLPLTSYSRWKIITRCCFSQALPMIYIGLIRQYNKSFSKEEKIPAIHLAKLMSNPSVVSACKFCEDIGLPCSLESSDSVGFITMKAAPISIQSLDVTEKIKNPDRKLLDPYVFGEFTPQWTTLSSAKSDDRVGTKCMDKKTMESSLTESFANLQLKTSTDDCVHGTSEAIMTHGLDWGQLEPRIDCDGVLILPSPVLWELIR